MSSTIFRIFKPNGPKEDAVERRRGQLRRAQKTYRDRKDKYTKALETELSHCRASEAKLVDQNRRLEATVQELMSLLSTHGIAAAPLMPGDAGIREELSEDRARADTSSASPAVAPFFESQSWRTDSLSPGRGHREDANVSPLSSTDWKSANSKPDTVVNVHLQKDLPSPARDQTQSALGPSTSQLGLLDQVTVGMEFVLELEKPCLAHIAGDPSKVDSPAGHALTASAQLFSLESPTWCTSYFPHNPTYHTHPTALLNNLLSLAPDVCPDGELTPVQIWNMVREQPHFATLKVATLQTLMDTIREAVKCHGFGAVVDAKILNSIFDTFLLRR